MDVAAFHVGHEVGLASGGREPLPHCLGRTLDDPWCARLATLHLLYLISTGDDIEKDLVTVAYSDLQRYAAELARDEEAAIHAH